MPKRPIIQIDSQAAVRSMNNRTPISSVWKTINEVEHRGWAFDPLDRRKAYVMACFSEIAYMHVTEAELAESDRYKVFAPSLVCEALRRERASLDLAAVMATVADVPIEIIVTEEYVYIVARVGPFVVVSVRGTRTKVLKDWLIDLDAKKNQARHGFHHRGFDDEATRALPLLEGAIANDDLPLYFTGHSLGGAVASILARRWPDQRRVRMPYLFASPRFGTQAAARRLRRYLFTRPGDFVPHVPPRFYGFSDEGAERHLLPENARPIRA